MDAAFWTLNEIFPRVRCDRLLGTWNFCVNANHRKSHSPQREHAVGGSLISVPDNCRVPCSSKTTFSTMHLVDARVCSTMAVSDSKLIRRCRQVSQCQFLIVFDVRQQSCTDSCILSRLWSLNTEQLVLRRQRLALNSSSRFTMEQPGDELSCQRLSDTLHGSISWAMEAYALYDNLRNEGNWNSSFLLRLFLSHMIYPLPFFYTVNLCVY